MAGLQIKNMLIVLVGGKMTGEKEVAMLQHLEELRRVLLISIIVTIISSAACLVLSDRILEILLKPIADTGNKIVYIGVTEALMTKINVSLFCGFLLALPITLWQFWSFIMPALHKNEKRYFTVFVVLSYAFFIAGISFGLVVVLNYAVKFLIKFGGSEIIPMLSIGKFVSFCITFLLPFGLVFELPLIMLLLAAMNIINYKAIAKKRKITILIIVVISMAMVPTPDIVTPLLMAVPLYLLYEFSASVVKLVDWVKKRRAKKRTEED